MRHRSSDSFGWSHARTISVATALALIGLGGCVQTRPQSRPSTTAPTASPAALSGAASVAAAQTHAAASDRATDPVAALIDATPETVSPSPRERSTPPPRPLGKTFNTAVVDENGRTRRIEIRLRDGASETRVDGQLVPPDRVLVHRRGSVEIVDENGARELSFNLPRGMTSLTRSKR